MEVAECKPYEIFWYQWSIYESVVVCIGGVSVQTDGVWPYEFFSKCWSVPPLYNVMYFVVLSHLSYISFYGLLCMFVPGWAIIRLYFEIDALTNDWLSDWYYVYRTVDQGCGVFLQTEHAYVGVFYVLIHVHPYYYYHWFMHFSTLLLFSISPMYDVSDTGYQWAPLHVCVGLSHHQALFWDRWVNHD